jgi:uncharacterized protein DUF3891
VFIQSAPPGRAHRAIMMHDHTALSGQFARAFGNAQFERPCPLDLVVYIIANHDAGWAAFDRDPVTDPKTDLPYTVFGTPARYILPTSKGSPDFNQRHHPYCGLLSSMHTWGIYNGRYGFTSAGRLSRICAEDRPAVDAMLTGELERQATLKAKLGASAEMADWVEEGRLFQNYKLLQFCDLLAIYFNTIHAGERSEQTFTHVPISRDRDVAVTICPKSSGIYALSPFPFVADGAQFAFAARPVFPGQHECEGGWAGVIARAPTEWETFRLVPG